MPATNEAQKSYWFITENETALWQTVDVNTDRQNIVVSRIMLAFSSSFVRPLAYSITLTGKLSKRTGRTAGKVAVSRCVTWQSCTPQSASLPLLSCPWRVQYGHRPVWECCNIYCDILHWKIYYKHTFHDLYLPCRWGKYVIIKKTHCFVVISGWCIIHS